MTLSKCGKVLTNDEAEKALRDCWVTPQDWYDALRGKYTPLIDVAAEASNKRCLHYFGPDHENERFRDAFAINWVDAATELEVDPIFWMNPPYSKVGKFMSIAHQMMEQGGIVLCLVSPTISANWWHDFVLPNVEAGKADLTYVRGRIQFEKPTPESAARLGYTGEITSSTNSRDSVFIVLRGSK